MSGNWRDRGFTPIPNIVLNNPAVPRCVRPTYEAISARAFGKRYSVFVSCETLAQDVGVSERTINRHLKVLEALRLIKRSRPGKGITNNIILTLKLRMLDGYSLSEAIARERVGLSACVLNRSKLTMKEAMKLASKRRKRQRGKPFVIQEAERILSERA